MTRPSNKNIAIYIAVAILVAGIYFLIPSSNTADLKKYNSIAKATQMRIDSLEIEVKKSGTIIDSLNKEILVLDNKNYALRERIYYIRKENEEKINTVDYYTVSELEKFFAKRYPANR